VTREEFDGAIGFLEGAFRTSLTDNERGAYWLLWSRFPLGIVMPMAVAFTQDRERSKYGFPRPADLIPTPEELTGLHMRRLLDGDEHGAEEVRALLEPEHQARRLLR
jgi:hypothetical protein